MVSRTREPMFGTGCRLSGRSSVCFARRARARRSCDSRFGGPRLRIARAFGSQVHPLGALLAPEPGSLDHRIRGMSEQVGLRLVQRCQCLLRRVRHDEMGETLKVTPHGPLERRMAQPLPLPCPPGSTSDGLATSHTPLAARRVPIAHRNLGCRATVMPDQGPRLDGGESMRRRPPTPGTHGAAGGRT